MSITDELLDVARRNRAELAARQPEAEAAARLATEAEQAATEARQAAIEAEAAAHPGRAVAGLVGPARARIGAALDAARAQAIAAVTDPTADPVRAWCDYRIQGARLVGEWDALSNHLATVLGPGSTPPGPGYRLPPLPAAPGQPQTPGAEGLVAFIENAVRQAAATAGTEAAAEATAAYWALNDPTPRRSR